ncbi:membrane-anchored mycosin MYCP [Streptomyces sp. SAI-208]|nr:membrane-anchored mycosin MYCP [Streptomyces sp. SAI-090]MDH6548321.1 membrane-anchored mycosin MYCP [Streptomyces sp. SAI-041]MDH6587656.1 membrane-anchored mycosin MYCP [Streptomyces sp. SAI-133]MDH6606932.1 membrane-anchored mycosin MYCP [Streptomyces sp. SAI-208]MDH6619805.1 membrane-anchored mycosin MYCP [Streptomyces sp. SAI-135]
MGSGASRVARRSAAGTAAVAVLACGLPLAGATPSIAAERVRTTLADDDVRFQVDDTSCSFPSDIIKGTPWSLQRVVLDQLWQDTKGKGVKVAVIDTGVDTVNAQLKGGAVANGKDYLHPGGNGRTDKVGHGTKVAGIIAARKLDGTGFVGLAPEATIIPVRQNDDQGSGNVGTMIQAIKYAADAGAKVINISQDTASKMNPTVDAAFRAVIKYAQEQKDALIVAAAGNDGADGKVKETYPAAYPGVLAVAASDRNNARAPFSQSGPFVGVAAPGIDMVSTVPVGGNCVDQGTSFAAPYVSGVAALIRAKHPEWSYEQVITQIEQTADRTKAGRDDFVGWGVIDPAAAVNDDTTTPSADGPKPDSVGPAGDSANVQAATLVLGESEQQRTERYALYVLAAGFALVLLLFGGGRVLSDWRRKQGVGNNVESTGS